MRWFEKEKNIPEDTDLKIYGFFGENRWLSNFWECDVMFKGLIFRSSEAAYQAAKSDNPKEWLRFMTLSAGASKKEGRKLKVRPDWDDIKLDVMSDIVLDKFLRNKDLADKLRATGDKYLEETNWWGDKYWGVCEGTGQNHLGIILMQVREKLDSPADRIMI